MIEYMTSIPKDQAKTFFSEFIDTQSRVLGLVTAQLQSEGVKTVPLVAAMESYFSEYVEVTRPTYVPWDDSVPDWIKTRPHHSKGREVYSEEAKIAYLRIGYFFGEALREACPHLRWALGDKRTRDATSPVVAGFRSGVECNPVIVCSVAMARIHDGRATLGEFTKLFETWKTNC